MSLKKKYGSLIWRSLKEYAIWEPGRSLRLGDYGEIVDGCFHYVGNVSEFGQSIAADRSPSNADAISLLSSGVSFVRAEARGPEDIGSLKVNFGSQGGAWLTASGLKKHSQFELKKVADALGENPKWKRSWRIVTGLRVASSFCVIATSTKRAEVELRAKAQVLNEFAAGTLQSEAAIEVQGTLSLRYLGNSGPISVGLSRLSMFGSGIRRFNDSVNHFGFDDFDLIPETDPPEALDRNQGIKTRRKQSVAKKAHK